MLFARRAVLILAIAACSSRVGSAPDAAPPMARCTSCLTAADCPAHAACVQIDGSDYCAATCAAFSDCEPDESCASAVTESGAQVSVCVPRGGTCDGIGCGICPSGTTCSAVSEACEPDHPVDAGGACAGLDPPGTSSCCSSCTPGSGSCQANGCYGGWDCNTSSCKCQAPPASCSVPVVDAGPTVDAPIPTGTVDEHGGTVSLLYFAVVGDTRPPNEDDTGAYPTSIIEKIYKDIQAMSPRPQFIVTTGDYMFADPRGSEGQKQMALYMAARNQFTGPAFAVMGNHECTGYTNSNCAGAAGAASNNFQAYVDALVTPLGQSKPYYTIDFADSAGGWTAKLIVTACNDWDAAQQSWLTAELARPTTYTFLTRHEDPGTTAPCAKTVDPLLASATYDLFICGHSHTYRRSGRQIIEGVGGAPISGGANYGFAIVAQQPGGGFRVTQYDDQTTPPSVVDTFTVP